MLRYATGRMENAYQSKHYDLRSNLKTRQSEAPPLHLRAPIGTHIRRDCESPQSDLGSVHVVGHVTGDCLEECMQVVRVSSEAQHWRLSIIGFC